jgi:hypothetical protein
MGNHHISRDVKIAMLNLYEQGYLLVKEILVCTGFSRSTFFMFSTFGVPPNSPLRIQADY